MSTAQMEIIMNIKGNLIVIILKNTILHRKRGNKVTKWHDFVYFFYILLSFT